MMFRYVYIDGFLLALHHATVVLQAHAVAVLAVTGIILVPKLQPFRS